MRACWFLYSWKTALSSDSGNFRLVMLIFICSGHVEQLRSVRTYLSFYFLIAGLFCEDRLAHIYLFCVWKLVSLYEKTLVEKVEPYRFVTTYQIWLLLRAIEMYLHNQPYVEICGYWRILYSALRVIESIPLILLSLDFDYTYGNFILYWWLWTDGNVSRNVFHL